MGGSRCRYGRSLTAPLFEMRLGQREIFRTRDLDIERIAGHHADIVTVMRSEASLVGGVVFVAHRALERVAKDVVAEHLRRLCRDDVRSIDRSSEYAVLR